MNSIKKIVMGLAVACAAAVLPAMADGVSISSDKGQITVTVAADTVAASTPVYLVWDTTDQGEAFDAWTNKEKIGDVTDEGKVFVVDGETLGLTDGAAIRVFVVADSDIELLEYIQSSGTQYIDTGIVGAWGDVYEAKFAVVSQSENNVYVAGELDNTYTDRGRYQVILRQSAGKLTQGVGGTGASGQDPVLGNYTTVIGTFYTVVSDFTKGNRKLVVYNADKSTQLGIDSTTKVVKSDLYNPNNYTIYLFAGNVKGSANYMTRGNLKISSFKLTRGGAVVKNLVAARQGTAVGMVDLANGNEFYPNKGSNSFTAGGVTGKALGEVVATSDAATYAGGDTPEPPEPPTPTGDWVGLFPPNIHHICVVAPCSQHPASTYNAAKAKLEEAGYTVTLSPEVTNGNGASEMSAAQKAKYLEEAWQNTDYDLIFAIRGGNGGPATFAALDKSKLTREVPFIGFSNISCLLNPLEKLGVKQLISGPSLGALYSYPVPKTSRDLLCKLVAKDSIDTSVQLTAKRALTQTVTGKPLGGHWPSMSANNAADLPDCTGRIVFLEVNGYTLANAKSTFDTLKGKWNLNDAAAIVIGQVLTQTAPEEMIQYITDKVTCPVYSGYPMGHQEGGVDFFAVDFGRYMTITPEGVITYEDADYEPPTPTPTVAAKVTDAKGEVGDGPFSCTLTVTDPDDDSWSATWYDEDGADCGATAPSYAEEGVYTNVVRVTADGYLDFVGTGVVTVTHYVPPTVASKDGTVTITIPAGLVTASMPVYLAWDTADKGDDFADWTNKAKIGDVDAEGGVFETAGLELAIPDGAAIRAFVATDAINLYSALTKPKSVSALLPLDYYPGKTRKTSGFDIDVQFGGTYSNVSGGGSFFGLADKTTAAIAESGASSEAIQVDIDNTKLSAWPHAYGHKKHPKSNSYTITTTDAANKQRATVVLRTGDKPMYGTSVGVAASTWPSEADYPYWDYTLPLAVFGRWAVDDSGTKTEYQFKAYDMTLYGLRIYEKPDATHQLAANYVPAEKDGVKGLYETMNGTFCPATAAGFTFGGDVTNKLAVSLSASAAATYEGGAPIPMTAQVTGAEGPANGTAYSCTLDVTSPTTGYTALWYNENGAEAGGTAPSYDAEGVYTNVVKVTADGYLDFYGTGVVTVTHYEPPQPPTVASEDGIITITVPAGLVTASTPVYLVWDMTDQGDTFAAWAHSAKIDDVTAEGGVFKTAGLELAIPDGATIRAFVASEVINLHSAIARTKAGSGYIVLGYVPGKTKKTSGFDIDAKFENMSVDSSTGASYFFGNYDATAEAKTESGTTYELFGFNFNDNATYYVMKTWPHSYGHTSYAGKSYNIGTIPNAAAIATRGLLYVRTGEKSVWRAASTYSSTTAWPAQITWDYDRPPVVFGRNNTSGDPSAFKYGDATLYGLKIYEKPSTAHVCAADYVPAEKDGEMGLYDTKNSTFYPVTGTGFSLDGSATNMVVVSSSASAAASYEGGTPIPMTAQVTGAEGPADGTAYSCALDVTSPTTGWTATWYNENGAEAGATAPSYDTEGIYTNVVKVTADGYLDFYGTGVVTVTHYEIDPVLAALKGLKISILGDSWSTLKNVTKNQTINGETTSYYYPSSNSGADVTQVDQMWWKITADALGLSVDTVDAWGGSAVSMVSSAGTAKYGSSFLNRINGLGDPDIIVIMPVGNDNWVHVTLRGETVAEMLGDYVYDPAGWTFDATSATTQKASSLYHYRPAVAALITRVREAYPKAKLYYAVSWNSATDASNGLKESAEAVCAHYGVPFIPMVANTIVKDGGNHPTAAGQLTVAQYLTSAISNDFARTDKPIAATVAGATGPANGTAYSCTLDVIWPATGWTALWYDENGEEADGTAPSYDAEGVYTNVVKVTADGYADFYGTGVVAVTHYEPPQPPTADGVSVSSADGAITVTVAAGTVTESAPVYLAWDDEDKDDAFENWTNSAKIGDVTEAGGVFEKTGLELAIPDGATIRAFVATDAINLYSALTKPKSVSALLPLDYYPGKTRKTSGFDIDVQFGGTYSSVSGGGSFFGLADKTTAAIAESGASCEAIQVDIDNTKLSAWPHASGHNKHPNSKSYTITTTDAANKQRATVVLRTGDKPMYGSLVGAAASTWPSEADYPYWDYTLPLAVFGRWAVDDSGTKTEYQFKAYDMTLYGLRIYEKPDATHQLAANYVPAEKDGVKGLYETMNGTFCPATAAGFTFEGTATNTIYTASSASDAATYSEGGEEPPTPGIKVGDNLTATFENGVCTISGTGAMWDGDALAELRALAITNLVIGEGITSISASAFEKMRSIHNVTIGSTVTSIGQQVFHKCYNLTNIVILTGATAPTVGKYAFFRCNSLTRITVTGGSSVNWANDAFTLQAGIFMNSDTGLPEIYPIPEVVDANGSATVLYGTNDLNGDWTKINSNADRANYHFFKIVIE